MDSDIGQVDLPDISIERNVHVGVGVVRHMFSLEYDLNVCNCEQGGDPESHLHYKGARWPEPYEACNLDKWDGWE